MPNPPPLADTAVAGEPVIRQAGEWLAGQLRGTLTRVFLEFDKTPVVSADGCDRWIEGVWGVVIRTVRDISVDSMADLSDKKLNQAFNGRVGLWDWGFDATAERVQITFYLSGRLAAMEADHA